MCAHASCPFSARYTVRFEARDIQGATRPLCAVHTQRAADYLYSTLGRVTVSTERVAA